MINQVTFNAVNFWEELGVALVGPPNYPIPAEIKEQVQIKGRNGSLTESTGYYNDIEINLSFRKLKNYGSERGIQEFNAFKSKINNLFNGVNKPQLMFSEIPNRYYKVKSYKVGAVTKITDFEYDFEVDFICDPFLYNTDDRPETQQGTIVYNGDIPNQPFIMFEAQGTGGATINCNGQQLTFRIEEPGRVQINMNPYSIVTLNGNPIETQGEPPVLIRGENQLNITSDFGWSDGSLKIIKNERYL